MIVELAGLPGAGKTTICRAVTVAHGGKGSIPLWRLAPSAPFFAAARRILLLCLTTRPLTGNRFLRGFNLLMLLRHYQRHDGTIILDQGLAQKLWSLLADAKEQDAGRRLAAIRALKPYAPAAIFWVETGLAHSIARMAGRADGMSRYDGLDREQAIAQLGERAALLRLIADEMARETGCRLVVLDGTAEPAANAAHIERFLASGAADNGEIGV
jgi:thymidylate kinase